MRMLNFSYSITIIIIPYTASSAYAESLCDVTYGQELVIKEQQMDAANTFCSHNPSYSV